MALISFPDLPVIGKQFQIEGDLVEVRPITHGHINDTYLAVYRADGRTRRYVHQLINHHVFKDPVGVMDNIRRVAEHIRARLIAAGADDVDRRVVTLVSARDGRFYHCTRGGDYWRTYHCIEGAHIHDIVENPRQAFQAAEAYGRFQHLLCDLGGPRLVETIPDFHHTPKRFAALQRALAADRLNRAVNARPEIEFVLAREPITRVLLDLQARGEIPERITHNDTKFNNVMLDDTSGEGLAVLDLDTVMPGLALYDFGDMVRSTTSPTAEDEEDLSKIQMEMPMFDGLVRGYLDSAGGFLNQAEKDHLAFAGKLITFEIGIRFLTDYLEGDHYFKVHRDRHNLDRCRTQFKLVASVEQQEEAMNRLVASVG